MDMNLFPPRGAGLRDEPELPPSQFWAVPDDLDDHWVWRPGAIALGKCKGRILGCTDDRGLITVATARTGKTTSMLIPNLRSYPGSMVVLDPKGELTAATYEYRRRFGQVHVLDPFGVTKYKTARHNPLNELLSGKPHHVAANSAQLAEALIIDNPKDPHWTTAAKNITRGFSLLLISKLKGGASLRVVRRMLTSTPAELERIFEEMAAETTFGDIVRNIGGDYLGKADTKEMLSIFSTAKEQTAPLDDIMHVMDASDFSMADLARGVMTIFVVLPGLRMSTHNRYLRLVVEQALAAMEANPVPRGGLPVWFMLEEFPTLGHLRSIETAAGLMPGMGVRLHCVLQDLSQLKTHYPNSWETFLGNAGIIQAFGNTDLTTTEYLSKLMGQTEIVQRQQVWMSSHQMGIGDAGVREQFRSVPLLAPDELAFHFARETNRQLLLLPGHRPVFMERMSRDDFAR